MAKKQVTVNEEMIRGIMAGDIPNYGKDISVDDIITTDENERTSRIRTAKSSFLEEMFCKGSRLISVSTIIGLYRSFYRL